MEKLLLKNGYLLDKSQRLIRYKADVLVEDGYIARIAEDIEDEEAQVIDCEGLFVAPGFIDIHTHVYKCSALGVDADRVGVEKGVTTVCDAGTAGPENLGDFIETVIKKARTRVFSEMHFSKRGLEITPEADDESKYDFDLAERVYRENKEYVCAIKARASNTTVGALGIKPIREAEQFAKKIGLPLYVHIGRALPYIEEVLDTLDAGDMITHTFHGKESNWMIAEDGHLKQEALRARARGVLFDVGHGEASFSFKTAKIAFPQGFIPDTVSTDLHSRNVDGPVYSLTLTMDKMMALGISLEDVVEMVTAKPAQYLKFSVPIGQLKVGSCGDFTVFDVEEGEYLYLDSDRNELKGNTRIVPHYAIVAGKIEMKK